MKQSPVQQSPTVFRPEDLGAWQSLYPADTTLGRAIRGFKEFNDEYVKYFREVKFDSTKTTAAHLFSQVLQTLQDYWSPVGEAATQRQVKHYRDLLQTGDQLAKAFLDRLKLGLPGAIVYFNKTAAIKYCPYTDLPFIGTPYSMAADGNWNAISHELGHYVYWNMGSSLADVRQKHTALRDGAAVVLKQWPQLQSQILSWLEEIFCDILGVRVGDVEFVASLRDLIKSSAGGASELAENDGSHPCLCVRPFVREHVLKLMGKSSGIDWDGFFKDAFGKGVADLTIEVFNPDLKDKVESMSREQLLSMLGAQGVAEAAFAPAHLPLTELVPAIEALVKHLSAQIDSLLPTLQAQPPARTRPLEQLQKLATEDSKAQGRQPYEVLLRPRILEGGEQGESHACWDWHGGWDHYVGTHNH